jgi:hypothetical protein
MLHDPRFMDIPESKQIVREPFVPVGEIPEHPLARPETMASMPPSPGAPLPPGQFQKQKTAPVPSKALVQAVSDDLFRLRKTTEADKLEISQFLDKMPPEFKTAEVQKKFYGAGERDPAARLTPAQQTVFNQFIAPIRAEIQQINSRLRNAGVPVEDLEWMHRVVKGQEPLPAEGTHEVPFLGTRTLPRTTEALQPRTLFVLENARTGTRKVVQDTEGGTGFFVWNQGRRTQQPTPHGEPLKPGGKYYANQQEWTVKTARTSELEKETTIRYQQSAAVNLADTLVKMRATERNIQYLDNITKTPDWLNWATLTKEAGGNVSAPAGWRRPLLPQLDKWKVHPKLADAFDDFYTGGHFGEPGAFLDTIRKVNRFAVGSLFWQPITHIENVAGHWYVARGFDWIRPTGVYSLFADGARAIKEVITMGKDYQSMLKHGSALISGGVENADFYMAMAKKFGLEVERDPRWAQIANKVGLGVPGLVRWWYKNMNKVLWQANDIFMLQRVYELERKGMSRVQAIREAEKHIPNYRIPTEVMGSRAFAKLMSDPLTSAFGRYHYGVFNSYANMVRDLVGKNATMEQRVEAVGNLFALGSLVFVIYPMVSYAIRQLTGDDKVKKLTRGPAAVPSAILQSLPRSEKPWQATDLYHRLTPGENKQWYDFLGSTITIAPALKEGVEQLANRDFFTGQHIEQPGEKSIVRRGVQRIEHAAGGAISPIKTIERGIELGKEKGITRAVARELLGTEDRTARQRRGQQLGKKYEAKEAKKARRHPGMIEKGIMSIFDYGKPTTQGPTFQGPVE